MENDNNNNLDAEQQQLRRLDMMRRLIQSILLRHKILLLLVLVLAGSTVLFALMRGVEKNPARFESRTRLIFMSRSGKRIRAVSTRELNQVLTRRSIAKKLPQAIPQAADNPSLTAPGTLELVFDRKQENVYTIVARANHPGLCVHKANAMAQLCIEEYINYRSEDLRIQKEIYLKHQQNLHNSLLALERQEYALRANHGVSFPEEELAQLARTATTQRMELADLTMQVSNTQNRLKRQQMLLGATNPAVLLQASQIRERLEALSKVEQELITSRQLYTELNPKIRSLVTHREALQREFQEFLALHGIKEFNLTISGLELLEKSHQQQLETAAKLEVLQTRLKAVEAEVQAITKRTAELQKLIPEFASFKQQRLALAESNQDNSEALAEIDYQLASVKSDLTQLEPANAYTGQGRFSKKNLAISAFAALVFTGLAAVTVLMLELIWGRIYDSNEIAIYPELNLLGGVPLPLSSLGNTQQQNTALDSLYYRLQNAITDPKNLFYFALRGGKTIPGFLERVEWNYALSGKRFFILELTAAQSFQDSPDYVLQGNIYRNNHRGVMLLENPLLLQPAEEYLLRSDLEVLHQEYDLVVITCGIMLKPNGVLIRQMTRLCDGAVVHMGAGHTRRKLVRQVLQLLQKHQLTIMTIVSGQPSNSLQYGEIDE